MATPKQRFSNCLWFDDQAEDAVAFYCSIFDNSRTLKTTRYTEESAGPSGKLPGSVLTIEFELDGQRFIALNGGPMFKFNEAVSIVVDCESQAETDRFWEQLTDGGDPNAQACGWLKDKYGLSWQVVPRQAIELITDPDPARAARATAAMMQMKKLDVAELQRAADGG